MNMGNMNVSDIYGLIKSISKDSRKVEDFGSGLLGEQIFVAAYQKMDMHDLEKVRFLLNKIIKMKKEYKRQDDAKKDDS